MIDLVGEFGCGLVVPGNEGAVCRVSAHTVGSCNKLHTTSEKQDVQGLLDTCFVCFQHLDNTTNRHVCKVALQPSKLRNIFKSCNIII